jgi:predicted RNA-binding Zn-ribbon protein involved in translation (DUF1610 family)
MSEGTAVKAVSQLPVYFACHNCGRLYLTLQTHVRGVGHFDCCDCGKLIHRWSGSFKFTDWKRQT